MEVKGSRFGRRISIALLFCIVSALVVTGGHADTNTLAAEVIVDSANGAGVDVPLAAGHYIIEASGQYQDAVGSIWPARLADAECSSLDPDPTWNPNRWGAAAVVFAGSSPLDDPEDLYVNGTNVAWTPVDGSLLCDANSTYRTEITLDTPGSVHVGIFDPFFYGDNSGALTVKFWDPELPDASAVLVGAAVVNSANPAGADSTIPLIAGQTYRIEATGSFLYDFRAAGAAADAECSSSDIDPSWLVDRYAGTPGYEADDLLDLYVNGAAVAWVPATDTGGGCNTADHTYDISFTPAETGLVNFKVMSPFYGFMSGTVQVRIFLVSPVTLP